MMTQMNEKENIRLYTYGMVVYALFGLWMLLQCLVKITKLYLAQ